MMKSWRESWRMDSEAASQAVILMFIPVILGVWLNRREAWGWREEGLAREEEISGGRREVCLAGDE